MNAETKAAAEALRDWAERQSTGPADPESMEDNELADWWADEAVHGAELARRLLLLIGELPVEAPELRELEPDVEDSSVCCPDCGDTLLVAVDETDRRRGATWTGDGGVIIGKSNDVQTIEIRLWCAQGHGRFEVPDVEDYA